LNKDLDAKRKAYAAAEIQEYWVLDLKHRQLKVFRILPRVALLKG
jgi:Uma2 family endonuclease